MKKFMMIFAMFTLLFITVNAQSPTPNIATNAVCTHSSGGSGTYGPQNYNDGIIPPAGSLPWGWTSGGTHTNSSAWIMFEWASPQTFGEFTFYHAEINRRYLTGADIQYWDGSNWVIGYSYLFPAPYTDYIKVTNFAPITSNKVRITNWVMAPVGQTSNPDFREIEIRNVCTDPQTLVSFNTSAVVTKPNPVTINYTMDRAYGTFNALITISFYTPQDVFVYSESTLVPFTPPQTIGSYTIQTSLLPVGFYKVQVEFNVMGICNSLENVVVEQVIMVVNPNTTVCEVYSGDVNNDGIVNYGDRASLNKYIHDANLQSTWLYGPPRYRADASTNAMTYYQWELQPSIPWQTPEGCYMDADGNGVVNNFDYIAIKLNYNKTHGTILPKNNVENNIIVNSQSISYTLVTPSTVSITIYDLSGRDMGTIYSSNDYEGTYSIPVPQSLQSGMYFVMIEMNDNAGFELRTIEKLFIK